MMLEFDFTGEQLKVAGMTLASESAESKEPGWNEKAYLLLLKYIPIAGQFMCEDFRQWAFNNGLSTPPSNRAFGCIISKAAKEKKIVHIGYKAVSNAKAHCTPASVWQAF